MDLYQILESLGATFETDLKRMNVTVQIPLSAFTTTAAPVPQRTEAPHEDFLRAAIDGENYADWVAIHFYELAHGEIRPGFRSVFDAVKDLEAAGWIALRDVTGVFISLSGTDIRVPVNTKAEVNAATVHLLGAGPHATINGQTIAEICAVRGWEFRTTADCAYMGKHKIPRLNGSFPLWKVLEGLFNAM